MITLQILSDKIEEKLLYKSMYSGLYVGKRYHSHCVTVSGFIRYSDGRVLDKCKDLDYIRMDITIDGYDIILYTHKDMRRNTLHYFHYTSENLFENGGRFHYDLYLVVDDVLDGKPYFTSELMERKFKLEKIRNKMVSLVKN